MAIFPFKGQLKRRELSDAVYLYEVAFHPSRPWLVGRTDSGLVAMDFAGEVLWTLEHAGRQSGLEWCANGERLAFEVTQGPALVGTTSYLELPSRTVRPIAIKGREPSWSPSCDELLLSAEGGIFRYSVNTQQATLLLEGSHAAWSPDGQSIVYRANDGAFHLATPNGVPGRRLFAADDVLSRPRWSPDSQYLLFLRKGGRGLELSLDCLEAKQVIVYRVRDGRWAWVQQVCKSAPTNFRWIKKGLLP